MSEKEIEVFEAQVERMTFKLLKVTRIKKREGLMELNAPADYPYLLLAGDELYSLRMHEKIPLEKLKNYEYTVIAQSDSKEEFLRELWNKAKKGFTVRKEEIYDAWDDDEPHVFSEINFEISAKVAIDCAYIISREFRERIEPYLFSHVCSEIGTYLWDTNWVYRGDENEYIKAVFNFFESLKEVRE